MLHWIHIVLKHNVAKIWYPSMCCVVQFVASVDPIYVSPVAPICVAPAAFIFVAPIATIFVALVASIWVPLLLLFVSGMKTTTAKTKKKTTKK